MPTAWRLAGSRQRPVLRPHRAIAEAWRPARPGVPTDSRAPMASTRMDPPDAAWRQRGGPRGLRLASLDASDAAGRVTLAAVMSLERNRADLERHAATRGAHRLHLTVLDDAGTISCVYSYPPHEPGPDGADAEVRSWVSAACGAGSGPVPSRQPTGWPTSWPFRTVRYARRA